MQFTLVGANHAHQLVANRHGNSGLFFEFLVQCCEDATVELVAEEMSTEVLITSATVSTACQVAHLMKLPHLLCDPDSRERKKLGIPDEVQIREHLGLSTRKVGVVEQIDEEKKKYWPIREAEWLRRIEALKMDNCLFILGPDHVRSFSQRLKDNGHSFKLLHARWEP